jgi:hypothetical protein
MNVPCLYRVIHTVHNLINFFNSHSGGWSPLGTSATEWPIIPAPGDYDDGEFGGMKIGKGNQSTEETCPSAILSTTNPTWPDMGANPGRSGGKPATNRLSYGAA